MRNSPIVAATLVCLLSTAIPTAAQTTVFSEDLIDQCTATTIPEHSFCSGFITAVFDLYGSKWCVTIEEAMPEFKRYLAAELENIPHITAWDLIVNYMGAYHRRCPS